MNPALLGLVAALCWGWHDFLVQGVSRALGIRLPLLLVLLFGFAFLSVALLLVGEPVAAEAPRQALALAAFSGVVFAIATLALYRAFAIGPIAVVAPLIGAYPVFSLSWAVALGTRPEAIAWAAMLAVIFGVAVVARAQSGEGGGEGVAATDSGANLAPPSESRRDTSPPSARAMRVRAVAFALTSSLGFAVAFAAAQSGVEALGELRLTWLARIASIAVVVPLCLARGARRPLAAVRPLLPLLALMGLLDAVALAAVVSAGHGPAPERAVVAASMFGVITVLMARFVARERISKRRWLGIALVFAGVAVLAGIS